ncbi:hypothetical protein KWH69_26620, partial [Escherichia coli]|nr:hypothetical protein [Escherichia coli]
KPEYHVVLCVRQEYFDGPELDRLILDAWSNVLGFASPGEAKPYQKQITRDVVRIPLYSITDWHRSPISDS